jgi:cytochrome c
LACALAVAAGGAHGAAGAGDARAGEAIYERCVACHSLAGDRTGPRHCGLFGRRAGAVRDFDYSAAMKHSGIVWNERSLDRFLAAPTRVIPGTSMGYSGIPDPSDRANLIAYLKQAGESAECR